MRKRRRGLTAAALALTIGFTPFVPQPPAAWAAVTFNVRDFGATGNGSSNDTAAINRAIQATSNEPGVNVLRFPPGTYRSPNSIHMKSGVTIHLDAGATIMGAGGTGYDRAEPNPNDRFQDYGHSHFHNAMIWGDRLTDIAFEGQGVIDGGGHLIRGNPSQGQADKIISLTRCNNLRIDGINLRRGGHFAILTNACNNITSNGLRISGNRSGTTSTDRDGWNVINARNVTITNARIEADDDALAFKSDWALGERFTNGNVRVSDSHLVAICCNALMFGSETCGNFTDYRFERITIRGSNKYGLGMVSMDGTVISNVHYRDITMTDVRGAIGQKVGTRRRCGDNPGIGRIENVTYTNIRSTGQSSNNFSVTLWGESGNNNRIRNVTFDNVALTVPGGNGCMGTGVPSNDPNNYNPVAIGTRPSYGFYLHRAHNVRFVNSSVRFNRNDCRPAILANTGSEISVEGLTAQRGSNSPFDVGFQNITRYCLRGGQNTTGGALRLNTTGGSQGCGTNPPPPPPPPTGRFEAEDATISQGTVDTQHAGFTGSGYVNYTNVAGGFVEWTVPRDAAGEATLTFRYANGVTGNRPMTITVNGETRATLDFAPTGAWPTWADATVTVPLNAGPNTIRATATGAEGGPNVDRLDVG